MFVLSGGELCDPSWKAEAVPWGHHQRLYTGRIPKAGVFQECVKCVWLGNISWYAACRSIWWWWIVFWRSLVGQRLALLLETGLSIKFKIFRLLCFAPNPWSNQATSYDVSTFHPTVLHFFLWGPCLEVFGKGWTSCIVGVTKIDLNFLQETEGDADEQEGKQGYLAARQCLRYHGIRWMLLL